jgi:hypothetical protein
MKDPIVENLVKQLKVKFEEANDIMDQLHRQEAIVHLNVGRNSTIDATKIDIISITQFHDYLK